MKYLQFALSAVALAALPAAGPKAHEAVRVECQREASKAPVCEVKRKPEAKRPNLFNGVKPVAKSVHL